MNDYIFCPLCGCSKWDTDKTLGEARGRLTRHKCSECKKFEYTQITVLVKHPLFVGVTAKEDYELIAEIEDYKIQILYLDKCTKIYKDYNVILKLEKVINFNWYNDGDILQKVKKYLVFS